MTSEPSASAVNAETVLDSLASVLRAWGRYSFDSKESKASEINATFEAWARQVLIATPPPDALAATSGCRLRDWPGLERFVADARSRETAYVVESLRDLRQVVWAFVEAFGRCLPAGQGSDERMTKQLDRLRAAAQGTDTGWPKSEAMRSASLIESAISMRTAPYKSHIDVLSQRLDQTTWELMESRRKARSPR